MTKRLRIAGLGEVLWDIYGQDRHVGGAPANFALHVQRLGHQGVLLSRVGSDEPGRDLLSRLKEEGLDVSAVQTDEVHPTGTVHITLDDEGIPRFLCTENVAFDFLEPFEPWLSRHTPLDALLFGTLAQRNPVSRRTIASLVARNPAKMLVFDVNLRGNHPELREIVQFGLKQAHLVKLNEAEFGMLKSLLNRPAAGIDEFARWLVESFELQYLALTLGPEGALVFGSAETVYSPGFRVPPVDTTGSGDAFAAGLVVKILEGESLPGALEFANALAALVCTQTGAVPAYRPDDVFGILRFSSDRRNWRETFRKWAHAARENTSESSHSVRLKKGVRK